MGRHAGNGEVVTQDDTFAVFDVRTVEIDPSALKIRGLILGGTPSSSFLPSRFVVIIL